MNTELASPIRGVSSADGRHSTASRSRIWAASGRPRLAKRSSARCQCRFGVPGGSTARRRASQAGEQHTAVPGAQPGGPALRPYAEPLRSSALPPAPGPGSFCSVLWILIPVLTCGLLLPVPFLIWAFRACDGRSGLVASAYTVTWLAALAALAAGGALNDGALSGSGFLVLVVAVIIGTVHLCVLRSHVFPAGRAPR